MSSSTNDVVKVDLSRVTLNILNIAKDRHSMFKLLYENVVVKFLSIGVVKRFIKTLLYKLVVETTTISLDRLHRN